MEPSIISNTIDFSNKVITIDSLLQLVKYLDDVYQDFAEQCRRDEQANERLKYEYRRYTHKPSALSGLRIAIYPANIIQPIGCRNFADFHNLTVSNSINNVRRIIIDMELNYSSGNDSSMVRHDNKFTLNFEPYDITLTRRSSDNDQYINQVANNIASIFYAMETRNTIFCTKQEKVTHNG